ncbi:STAS domain-containing protein [Sphaerotilus sp.]|uniref:STAS domain-containing protein n=1 Tax=Sphaerotilus sp. TaxID=2093942 RepID=UPI002ACDC2E6|nr:STAS domain-containing protein [Sphaerotilus sp.]MDZ7854742.1 STAS domain-containing protein [Sphaerotilus sp.]
MPSPSAAQALQQLISDHHDALLTDWKARLGIATLTRSETDTLHVEMNELLDALRHALGQTDPLETAAAQQQLDGVLRSASQVRAARGQAPEASVRFVQSCKDALLARLMATDAGDPARQTEALWRLQTMLDRCVMTLVSQFVATRESVIRSQAQSLLDMSTPVITLWDSILLLPLVGIVDSVRAVQVAERLLEAIGRTEAEVTLIDVTGVPVMDTSVARHLLRTVAAAEMLGTQVILTGISPSTALTMVKLGIDLSAVPTRGSLKAGVILALRMTGRQLSGHQQQGG